MYHKNLTQDLRLRMTETDFNFLKNLSVERNLSVSEIIRQIIGEYRRSIYINEKGADVHGNTKTTCNDKL